MTNSKKEIIFIIEFGSSSQKGSIFEYDTEKKTEVPFTMDINGKQDSVIEFFKDEKKEFDTVIIPFIKKIEEEEEENGNYKQMRLITFVSRGHINNAYKFYTGDMNNKVKNIKENLDELKKNIKKFVKNKSILEIVEYNIQNFEELHDDDEHNHQQLDDKLDFEAKLELESLKRYKKLKPKSVIIFIGGDTTQYTINGISKSIQTKDLSSNLFTSIKKNSIDEIILASNAAFLILDYIAFVNQDDDFFRNMLGESNINRLKLIQKKKKTYVNIK